MRVINSVGVLSVAKIMALIHATFGLILVPFFILMVAISAAAGGAKNTPFGAFSGVFAIVFAVMAPVFYGAMGFVIGAIGAAFYNFFARWVGGIEVNVGTSSPASYPLQVG